MTSDERRPILNTLTILPNTLVQVRNIQAYRAKHQRLPVRGSNEPNSRKFPGELEISAVGRFLRVEQHTSALFRSTLFTLSCQLPTSATQVILRKPQINPRLQRHFLVFAIGMPSPTSLLAIFETFLEGHLRQEINGKRFQVGVVQVCASLIKGALSVHKEVGLLIIYISTDIQQTNCCLALSA